MDKHTSGPWRAFPGRTEAYIYGPEQAPPVLICTTYASKLHRTEDDANAKLIASAPEMLDALRVASKALDAICNEMTVGDRFTNAGQFLIDALGPVRDAIAKAVGE